MRTHLLGLAAVILSTTSTFALSDNDLRAALEQRFKNDRTGACVAAAVIDSGTTASAYFCADANSQRPYDEHTAFEIGSVTKTMTAALLAEFIARGEVALSDPIAKLLPPGTSVPSFDGREITIADIVTHTSGLPSYPWRMTDKNNPYAALTERDLIAALATTRLTRAPGVQWEYSNFAMMVLSYALAKHSGKDYETLLRERLLAPLGMSDTYITKRPPQVRLAQGHLPNAMIQMPWDFPVDMAGVGGVRATLPDMVRYVEGELGTRESEITLALARTQQQVASVGGHTMGMNWGIVSTTNTVDSHTSSRMKAAPAVIRRWSPSIAKQSAPSSCSATQRSPPSAALARSGCTCSIPRCLPARRASLRPPTPSSLTPSSAVIACKAASRGICVTRATR
jgi:serine-type D-Ala-D-Ala carboxypeptidase/endopeptidase